MNKIIKYILVIIAVFSLSINQYAYAEKPTEVIAKDGTKHYVFVVAPEPEQKISMLQYSDMIGEAPKITVYIDGELAEGSFSYPNYDNSRLGVWDLEWVFTPADENFYPITGTMKFEVRPREEEETVDEPTMPSLTAKTISLTKETSYDININNKISGAKYKWTSSNPKVAKVNAKNGLVTAISEGKAIITCEITLLDNTVQTLISEVVVSYDDNATVLSDTELDLDVGEKYTLKVENAPTRAKYKFTSSDKAIAKVGTTSGKVTAVSPGEAYITCTITTPDNQVIVLRCDVLVNE